MINDLPKVKDGKPSSFIKLVLTNASNRVLSKKRTGTKVFDVNPVFEEVFYFPIQYTALSTVTLGLSVYTKKKLKEELLCWCSFGLSSSGPKARKHWDKAAGTLS